MHCLTNVDFAVRAHNTSVDWPYNMGIFARRVDVATPCFAGCRETEACKQCVVKSSNGDWVVCIVVDKWREC